MESDWGWDIGALSSYSSMVGFIHLGANSLVKDKN